MFNELLDEDIDTVNLPTVIKELKAKKIYKYSPEYIQEKNKKYYLKYKEMILEKRKLSYLNSKQKD